MFSVSDSILCSQSQTVSCVLSLSLRQILVFSVSDSILCSQSQTVSCVHSVSLQDFAKLLISLGVVNAINLDGGGSTTFVDHSILVNVPSDIW